MSIHIYFYCLAVAVAADMRREIQSILMFIYLSVQPNGNKTKNDAAVYAEVTVAVIFSRH